MTKKEEREYLYNLYNGKCAYCGNKLPNRWHVDHKFPIQRNFKWNKDKTRFIPTGDCANPEFDVLDNKLPACPSCNINKHSLSVEGFRDLIQGFINSLNRDSTQYKIAKRYGLVKETPKRVEFYYEREERGRDERSE